MQIRVHKDSFVKPNSVIFFEDENDVTVLARVSSRGHSYGDEIGYEIKPFNYRRKFIIALRNVRLAKKHEVEKIVEDNPHWFLD